MANSSTRKKADSKRLFKTSSDYKVYSALMDLYGSTLEELKIPPLGYIIKNVTVDSDGLVAKIEKEEDAGYNK